MPAIAAGFVFTHHDRRRPGAAIRRERDARHHRRLQAVLLVAEGRPAGEVAALLWLPRQCSELNAMDHLWRPLERDLAANRQRPDLDALAARAEAWVLALSAQDTLRKAGLLSKNCWLKNVRTNFCSPT